MKKFYFLLFSILIINSAYSQWNILTSGVTTNLRSVFCITADKVLVTGESGLILKTTDGGVTWVPEISNTTQRLNAIFFADTLVGYAVGQAGVIVKTVDGGNTWGIQNSNSTHALTSVFFTSADTGYVTGLGTTFIKTTDGGINWNIDTAFGGCCQELGSIVFTSAAQGYMLGYDVPGTIILSTNDTANTWSITGDYNASSDNWWHAHSMTADATGNPIVAGEQGIIQNGFGMWNMYGSPVSNARLNAVCNNHSGSNGQAFACTAVGANGVIGLYTNMGPSTCNQVSGVTSSLSAVTFYDSLIGYIAGDSGVILKTINAGYLTSVNELQNSKNVFAYPNPFLTETTFSTNKDLTDATLVLYNSFGQEVKQIAHISGRTIILQRDHLPAGIYFIYLTENDKMIGTGKLMMQD
jgi:photosystem II stability/assembly factor-like uncharacterized protein